MAPQIHRVVQNSEDFHFVPTGTDQENVTRLLDLP